MKSSPPNRWYGPGLPGSQQERSLFTSLLKWVLSGASLVYGNY